MISLEAYKVEIRPTREQETLLRKHCGLSRYVYNWALGERVRWWDANKDRPKAERDPEPRAVELSRRWTKEHPEWSSELQRNTVTYALDAVDDAFKSFFRRVKAATPPYGFPRFKAKGKSHDSFTIQDQSFRAEPRAIKLGKIGMVETRRGVLPTPIIGHEPKWRWLRGRVLRINISRETGRYTDRWYASIMVEREREDPIPNEGDVVGVDLGISMSATCSDGRVYEASRSLENNIAFLGRLQMWLSHKQPGSGKYRKLQRRIAALHKQIADERSAQLHLASRDLATTASVVVTEGYDIRKLAMRTGPTRGRFRATVARRRMMSTGLGELRRQIEYKARWYGARFEKTAKDYPSDITCSRCGTRNEHMRDRTDSGFDCRGCGHTSTRQINTAELLARLGRGEPFPATASSVEETPQEVGRGKPVHNTPRVRGRSRGSQVRDEAGAKKGVEPRESKNRWDTRSDGGTA